MQNLTHWKDKNVYNPGFVSLEAKSCFRLEMEHAKTFQAVFLLKEHFPGGQSHAIIHKGLSRPGGIFLRLFGQYRVVNLIRTKFNLR